MPKSLCAFLIFSKWFSFLYLLMMESFKDKDRLTLSGFRESDFIESIDALRLLSFLSED